MSIWFLVAFVLTNIFLDLAPGSAVQRVVAEGMAKGLFGAQAAILGVLAADFIWCFLAISALFTVMETVPLLLYGSKWFGLVCLVVLLARALRIAVVGRGVHVVAPGDHERGSGFDTFRSAFLMQMRHPTTMIFFFAVLSVFAGSREGWEIRLADLGLFAVILEWPVFALYAFCGAEAARAAARRGAKTIQEALASVFLLTATGFVAAPSVSVENR